MHTLGYNFKPWVADKAIADGLSILRYVQEAAHNDGTDAHIRYQHRVKRARWSTEDATWTLEIARGAAAVPCHFTCSFLFMCAGYFSYQGGHEPHFEGRDQFHGPIIHPQAWPEDLDYTGKQVIIIGSGATAVTLLPSMADTAAHVTMVQRSPSYVVAWPDRDRIANTLRRLLPAAIAYRITRWKNIALQRFAYRQSRIRPSTMRKQILWLARRRVGPDFDVETHLNPSYDPWDERLCLAPNGDFFEALRTGQASIVTGHIDRFTQRGLQMKTGEEISADIIVTATGLSLVLLGEVEFLVDGQPVDFPSALTYKGVAYSNVPNMCTAMGYVNASWTLRIDLVCAYVCRLLNHMRETDTRQCTPRLRPTDHNMETRPFIDDFSPGYMARVHDLFPKQGDREPWLNPQDYSRDRKRLTKDALEDGVMQFLR
jgi:cation diffusion facilitator CzcD-associated flavoprotein CzcO